MIHQGTKEWLDQRLGKVTASRLNDVMMDKTRAGYQNYLAQLVCERLTGQHSEQQKSAAMQHGNDTEPRARAMYELQTGLEVSEVGFVDHPIISMTGASPDGLVGKDGMIEIKCPQPAKHLKTLTGGNINTAYARQMQWQMVCTGREWCDFVSFSPEFPDEMQLHIRRVEFDPGLTAGITDCVEIFLAAVDAKIGELSQVYREAA